jgi:hypothetical protein
VAATSEQDMREVAQRVVRDPFIASASFRTVAEVEPLGGLAGVLLTFGQWVWIKKRSRLPAYPFVVLTNTELIVLEFIFGATLRMKRVVGRWRIDQVSVVDASPERRRAKLVLPLSRSPVEIEGAFGSDAEHEVVSRLRQLMPDQ